MSNLTDVRRPDFRVNLFFVEYIKEAFNFFEKTKQTCLHLMRMRYGVHALYMSMKKL